MPSRKDMIATAVRVAKDMGWDVESEDLGSDVCLLLSAPGASEQMVTAPLPKLVRAMREVGQPTNYPVLEEDYASHEDPADAGDPSGEEALNGPFTADAAAALAEAEDHADEPTELEKVTLEEPDGSRFEVPESEAYSNPNYVNLDVVDSVPAEVVELAQEPLEVKSMLAVKIVKASVPELRKRAKALGAVGYSRLRRAGLQVLVSNLERVAQGLVEDYGEPEPTTIMNSKEVKQAAEIDNQDRGGLPRPEQIVNLSPATLAKMAAGEEIEFEGRTIVARQGNDARVLGSRIKASVKRQWEGEGWTFTHVSKEEGRVILRALTSAKRAAQNIGRAAVSVRHERGAALIERHPNGRTHAKPGYVFRVFKGNKSFTAATVNEALWRSKGWNLAVKAV